MNVAVPELPNDKIKVIINNNNNYNDNNNNSDKRADLLSSLISDYFCSCNPMLLAYPCYLPCCTFSTSLHLSRNKNSTENCREVPKCDTRDFPSS